ncbi:MAG: class II fructose-bisphosphatase [Alphaproteobacteria bacterium]
MFKNKNLIQQILKISEQTAVASFPFVGKNDKMGADGVATDTLREGLNEIDMRGVIVIGEGEMDEAPMLYIGEEVGTGNGDEIDIAVDPIDGTTPCAKGLPGSCVVIALSEKGNMLNAPDMYMDKIAVGGGLPNGVIDITKSAKENIIAVATAKNKPLSEMVVCTLERDRHNHIIDDAKELGCELKLLGDGDVAGVIATTLDANDPEAVDIFIGKGGAPEGVVSAAALACLGGQMQATLTPEDDEQIERMKSMGLNDIDKIYNIDDLAKGELLFCGTSITDGIFGRGVKQDGNTFTAESLIVSSLNRKVERFVGKHDG